MTMKWLMTVQEVGTPSLALAHWPPGVGVEFNLMPLRLAADPDIGNEPVPNPNCFDTVKRWPKVVEVRRPDGTRVSAELYPGSVHINFPYALRLERDEAGRMRNPWRQLAILRGLNVAEVPPGSEVWGEVNDEDAPAGEDL